jgi:hypothetical protein
MVRRGPSTMADSEGYSPGSSCPWISGSTPESFLPSSSGLVRDFSGEDSPAAMSAHLFASAVSLADAGFGFGS